MDKQYRTFDFRIDNIEHDSGHLDGYATVFNILNPHYDEIFHNGAFAKTIRETNNGAVPIISEHWGPWIGMGDRAVEDDYGLAVSGDLAIKKNVNAQGIHELAQMAAKAGRNAGISIGFTPIKYDTDDDHVTHQREVKLHEWSICPPGFQSLDPAILTDVRGIKPALRSFILTPEGRAFLKECFDELGIKQPALEPSSDTQAATSTVEPQGLHSITESLDELLSKLRRT